MLHPDSSTQTFADQVHTGLMVALWLDPSAAATLALPNGEPRDALHVTLCYVPDADQLDELTRARAITSIERVVSWHTTIDGKVGGIGRFAASETSPQDVVVALVDVPGLVELRGAVVGALEEAGCPPSTVHGFTPHVTLAYVEPGAELPVDRLADVPLSFRDVTIKVGDGEPITIPLTSNHTAIFAQSEEGMTHVFQAIDFTEAPEWSPFLPVPGTYSHPVYGQLDFSPEAYGRIVDNFQSGIYQDRLPVNTEHDPHSAGAVGWITDMRLAETGAIEAKVDWNERGRKLIEGDRYKYVSAEYLSTWADPVDPDQRYQDVAVGLALTTRPYFKPRVLPPLAASEASSVCTAGNPGKEIVTMAEPNVNQPAGDKPVQLSEAEIAAFRQFQEAGGLSVLTQLSEARSGLEEAGAKIATMERTGLVKRFSDEVRGRSDANSIVWPGDVEAHVKHAVKLAETFGEDSDEVRHYVESNRASAKQLNEAGLFNTIGTSQSNEVDTQAKVDTLVTKLRETDPTLTREQAEVKVYADHPTLYADAMKGN